MLIGHGCNDETHIGKAFFKTTNHRRLYIGRSAFTFDGQDNICTLDDENINFIFELAPKDKFMVFMEVGSRPDKFIDKPGFKEKVFLLRRGSVG
jgi:hypothetical protein